MKIRIYIPVMYKESIDFKKKEIQNHLKYKITEVGKR